MFSFKSTKRTSSGNSATTQTSIPGKSFATEPPKKIIRALYDYRPQGPGELKFGKGDFLYVTGNENNDDWFEAYDPPSNMRGMVPVSYFEVVSRKDTIPTVPIHSAAALAAATISKDPVSSTVSSNRSSGASSTSTNKRSTTGSSSTAATTTSVVSTTPNPNLVNLSSTASLSSSSSSSSTVATLNNNNNINTNGSNNSISPSVPNSSNSSIAAVAARFSQKAGHSQLYGVVMYDFKAERSDELSATAGESIIIIAKSNEEWFVAKPIGRLGGPGLIPISFIEVRDIGTVKPVENVEEAILKANVPRVEEWKRMAAEYKASSIPLGKLEDVNPLASRLRNLHLSNGSQQQAQNYDQYHLQQQQQKQSLYSQNQQSHPISQYSTATSTSNSTSHQYNLQVQAQPQQQSFPQQQQPQTSLSLQQTSPQAHQAVSLHPQSQTYPINENEPYVVSVCVDRYAFSDDRYWYLVVAELSTGKYRHLCRFYQDFYDFQINLLDEFPDEAGRTGQDRSLPFMPGPLTYVNDSISAQRRVNLDEYVKNLINLPSYISRSPIVQKLFAIRTGDIESASPNSVTPQPPVRVHKNTPEVHEQPPSTLPTSNNNIVNATNGQTDNPTPVTTPTATPTTITAPGGHLDAPDTQSYRNSTMSTVSYSQSQNPGSTINYPTQLYPDIDTSRRPSFVAPDDAFNPKQSVYLEEGRQSMGNVDGLMLQNDNSIGDASALNQASGQHHPEFQRQYEGGDTAADSGIIYHTSNGEGSETRPSSGWSGHVERGNNSNNLYPSNPSIVGSTPRDEYQQMQQPHPDTTNSHGSMNFTEPQHQLPQHQSKASNHPSFQEVYVKIKVFHEDDLIAIRVSNAIPFNQLSDKIAERLGLEPDQIVLLHKDEISGEMVELRNSDDFLKALGNKVKLVLCAR